MAHQPKYGIGQTVLVTHNISTESGQTDVEVFTAKITALVREYKTGHFLGAYRVEPCSEKKPLNFVLESALSPLN